MRYCLIFILIINFSSCINNKTQVREKNDFLNSFRTVDFQTLKKIDFDTIQSFLPIDSIYISQYFLDYNKDVVNNSKKSFFSLTKTFYKNEGVIIFYVVNESAKPIVNVYSAYMDAKKNKIISTINIYELNDEKDYYTSFKILDDEHFQVAKIFEDKEAILSKYLIDSEKGFVLLSSISIP